MSAKNWRTLNKKRAHSGAGANLAAWALAWALVALAGRFYGLAIVSGAAALAWWLWWPGWPLRTSLALLVANIMAIAVLGNHSAWWGSALAVLAVSIAGWMCLAEAGRLEWTH